MESLKSFMSSFRSSARQTKGVTMKNISATRGVKTKKHSDGKEYVHKRANN